MKKSIGYTSKMWNALIGWGEVPPEHAFRIVDVPDPAPLPPYVPQPPILSDQRFREIQLEVIEERPGSRRNSTLPQFAL